MASRQPRVVQACMDDKDRSENQTIHVVLDLQERSRGSYYTETVRGG